MNEELKGEILCAEEELEELQEGGDLEDILEASARLGELQDIFKRHEKNGSKAIYTICGLCGGSGKQSLYEDTWNCPPCNGVGGSWS